jgi:hypothetical protein
MTDGAHGEGRFERLAAEPPGISMYGAQGGNPQARVWWNGRISSETGKATLITTSSVRPGAG